MCQLDARSVKFLAIEKADMSLEYFCISENVLPRPALHFACGGCIFRVCISKLSLMKVLFLELAGHLPINMIWLCLRDCLLS